MGKATTWSEIELAILRDARVPVPEPPRVITGHTLEVTVIPRKTMAQFHLSGDGAELPGGPGPFKTVEEVVAIKEKLVKESRDLFYHELDEFQENVNQYQHQCILIKSYIGDFLQQSPILDCLRDMAIRRKTSFSGKFSPTHVKPVFYPAEKTFEIYEVHNMMSHINTELRVHEAGYIAFFVTTYEEGQTQAQTYFFSLRDYVYHTRADDEVKQLGESDKWALSYFNDYGYGNPPESYTYCFVCGRNLHYPAQPVKIGNSWVFLLKPCCSCFNKLQADPAILEKAIARTAKKYGPSIDLDKPQV